MTLSGDRKFVVVEQLAEDTSLAKPGGQSKSLFCVIAVKIISDHDFDIQESPFSDARAIRD